jgi:hypothetical protein
MTKISRFFGASAIAAVLAVAGTAAQATVITPGTPITTPPPVINATGNVTAIYVFSDAGDRSTLDETTPSVFPLIFDNKVNIAGDLMNLGNQAGPVVFSLHDTTTLTNYLTDTPDGAGNYHAAFTTTYSDFGVGALPAVVATFIAGLPAGTSVTFVGWEDRLASQGSDFDYNDLIFAFTNVGTARVPEPLTLSLFGAGLAGAAAFRRRRKNKNAA